MNINRRRLTPVLFLSACLIATEALAVIPSGGGFHLIVTPGESLFDLNLDGVARLQFDGNTECAAALISKRHLLSAAHCFDEDGDGIFDIHSDTALRAVLEHHAGRLNVEFSTNDVSLPDNWLRLSADISIITLGSAVPEVFPPYSLSNRRDEVGKEIVVVGYGSTGTGELGSAFSLDEKLAGLNRYEAFGASIPGERFVPIDGDDMLVYDFDSGLPDHNTLEALGLSSDLGFGSEEAKSAQGDSGGPVFINGTIAGISSFGEWGFDTDFDPDVNGTWGELSFNTRVSSFQEFIADASNGEAVFVPEPRNDVILLAGLFWLLGFERRTWIKLSFT